MAPPLMLYTIASDNFNRANANPIGGNWTTEGGTNAVQIVSNAVEATVVNTTNFAYWNANTFPNDQWGQVTAVTLNPADTVAAFNLTLRSAKANPRTFYQYYMQHPASATATVIQKIIAGVGTTIVQNATVWASGDIALATVIGTTVTLYKGGVQVAQGTDGALASGPAGISARPVNALANVVIDNWSAGGFVYNLLQMMGCGV